jgi:acyl carrier protein
MPTIAEQVTDILVEQLGIEPEDVKPAASLEDDLGADSIDAIEITMYFEETFDIEIPDEDVDRVKTVQDIITYIEGRVGKK